MTVSQPIIHVTQREDSSDAQGPLNLLNDFAELGALLLSELEMAGASQHGASATPGGNEAFPGSFSQGNAHLLDAFLLAVGMNQVLEDYLHRDIFALAQVSRNLPRLLPSRLGHPGAAAARRSAQAFSYIRALLPGERRLIKCQQVLSAFVQQLADQIARSMRADASEAQGATAGSDQLGQATQELLLVGRDLLGALRLAPKALQRSVIRLPACFRSFDQYPADCQHIVQKFAARWPERKTPLVVIGIRTSGSYLAPLYAAFLRLLGYEHVQAFTLRPGQVWLAGERGRLLKHVQPGGRALLVDDPPNSGASLVQIVHALEQMGLARQSIHPVIPIFGSLTDLPPLLQGYEAIYLLWEEWAIHGRLTPRAVEEALSALLTGRTVHIADSQVGRTEVRVAVVRNVECLPLLPEVHYLSIPSSLPAKDLIGFQLFRGHVRGLYRVELLDERSGKWVTHQVYVKGVGLGYLGTHSLTLAEKLARFLPEVYGVRDGLLYRAWIPEEQRLSNGPPLDTDALAERVAAYVAARQQSLALPEDVSERLSGRHPLWQRGNDDLARFAFGRMAALVRPVLLDMMKYLLLRPVTKAAVVDGSMAPGVWFLPASKEETKALLPGTALKVEFDDRVFSNQNLDYCDVFYDLASAAAYLELQTGDAAFADLLRQHYAKLTGESSSDERWHLYQLLALNVERDGIFDILYALQKRASAPSDQIGLNGNRPVQDPRPLLQSATAALEATRRTISRIQERYYGERFLGDVAPPASGPLCAIDLDGVLETGWLSSVATSPAGALALRALARHGYRPVIATGRSLDEVRERCQAYRLAGGMGEYGAVIYNALTGETRVLLSTDEQADLDALRSVLRQMPGIYVNSAYRYAVRAYRVKDGGCYGLSAEMIEEALRLVPGRERLRPILGMGQTDFMVTTVDKGTGLSALARFLAGASVGQADEPTLAFAAGDSASDLAMFRLAKHAFAPANADREVRIASEMPGGHLHIMKAPLQAGLLQAVSQFLGHDPRRCSLCQPPSFSLETHLLLTLLAARDMSGSGKIKQAALLARYLKLAK